jgi:hypothetical protein
MGACTHPITRPNPPEPARMTEGYAGRIVLRTPALRDHVATFAEAWQRRLALLGATGHVTFDGDAAVFDVYDVPGAALPRMARALADPGGYALRTARGDAIPLAGGNATHWKPATDECRCGAILRVVYNRGIMAWIDEARGALPVVRNGAVTGLASTGARVEWRADERGAREPVAVEFALPDAGEAGRTLALALAGGELPASPRIERVEPAAGR